MSSHRQVRKKTLFSAHLAYCDNIEQTKYEHSFNIHSTKNLKGI